MDRLTSSCTHSPSGTQYSHFSYGADGNILSKTGVGGYTYDSARPHAVTGVQNTDGIITDDTQTVTYNAFGKVLHIEEGDYTLDYDYGTDRQRWRSTLTRSVSGEDETVRSVRYCDGEDIITSGDSTYSVTYLDGGVLCIHPWGTATYRFYKADTDLLGSVTSVVKGDGTPVFRAGYDEWGVQDVSQNDLGLIRGYTGHEMLPELSLVNMNGRMYDPVLARFLSPDDYVQLPSSAQGFNRYAYCMNNPLKYVDPSGEFIATIFGFFKGIWNFIFNGAKWNAPFKEAAKNFHYETKLFGGLFQGSFKQIISRWFLETPQTLIGLVYSDLNIGLSKIETIEYFDGATYIINKNSETNKGITFGSFINIKTTNEIPYTDNKFDPTKEGVYMHEYGHYRQSQELLSLYLPVIGLLSFASATIFNEELFDPPFSKHKKNWVERWANKRAAHYFKDYDVDWNKDVTLYKNPHTEKMEYYILSQIYPNY